MDSYCSSIQVCNTLYLSEKILIQRISDIICRQGLVSCSKEEHEYVYKVYINPEWVSVFAGHWNEPSAERRREASELSRELHLPCLSVGEYSIMDNISVTVEYFDNKGEAVDYFGYDLSARTKSLPKADWSAILNENYTTERFASALAQNYDSARMLLESLAPVFGIESFGALCNYQDADQAENIVTLYFKLKRSHKRDPPTVKTAFNDIYGAELEKVGFIRPKLKQLYYVRMVGDEILHIVGINDMKSHLVPFGSVATVYRQDLHLNKSYRQNEEWLKSAMQFYVDDCAGKKEYDKRIRSGFAYMKEDPFSVASAISGALDATIKWILPVLDNIQSLQDVLDFYKLGVCVPQLPLSENHFSPPFDDRAICFLLDDPLSDLEKRYMSSLRAFDMEAERLSHTPQMIEDTHARYREYKEESRQTISRFLSDTILHLQTLDELNQRKHHNTELLKKYGII